MPALPPDTERLHFAWWRESDLDDARALWGDPRVTALIDKRDRLPEAGIAQRSVSTGRALRARRCG